MSEKTILWIVIVVCIAIHLIVSDICNCIKDRNENKNKDENEDEKDFKNQNKTE